MNNKLTYALIVAVAVGVSLVIPRMLKQEAPVTKKSSPPMDSPEVPVRDLDHPLWRGTAGADTEAGILEEFKNALFKTTPGDPDRKRVYKKYLAPLGVKRMVGLIEKRKLHCHGVLHDLGYVIEQEVGDLETSLSLCQDACSYACIHGALKAHFASGPEGDLLSDSVEDPLDPASGSALAQVRGEILRLCREDSKRIKDFFRGNCAHAVGHAFAQTAGDVPGSVRLCRMFEGSEMRFYCHTGVFMELEDKIAALVDREGMTSEEERMAELDYCTSSDEWASACMRFTPQGVPKKLEGVRLIASHCDGLEGVRRRQCFNGLGFMGRYYVVRNPEEVGRVCSVGDETDQKLCMIGLFSIKKDHRWTGHLGRVCEAYVEPRFRNLCRDELNRPYYKIKIENQDLNAMFGGA